KFERGEKTEQFYEQCYIQLSLWMSFKKIKKILKNNSLNINNNFYEGFQSAIDMKNYSLKKYSRCTNHKNCQYDYFDLNIHCNLCNDFCKEFCELLIVYDNSENELNPEDVGPFIFGDKNFDLNIGSKNKPEKNSEKIFENAVDLILNNNYKSIMIIGDTLFAYVKTVKNKGSKPCIILLNELVNLCKFESNKFLKELYKNCLIINLGTFDLRKKDEDGNLTNQFLLDGGSETICYFDSSGNEHILILTLEDFEYNYTLNYSNENKKNKYRLDSNNDGESSNTKRARHNNNIESDEEIEIL
ncbi:41461_t:CDS:2, partial [Gigaspora margarita]